MPYSCGVNNRWMKGRRTRVFAEVLFRGADRVQCGQQGSRELFRAGIGKLVRFQTLTLLPNCLLPRLWTFLHRRCHKRDDGTTHSRGRNMSIFSEIFSWWGGNTWSNRIYTALRGRHVGTDAEGNRYYVQSRGVGPLDVPRR